MTITFDGFRLLNLFIVFPDFEFTPVLPVFPVVNQPYGLKVLKVYRLDEKSP